MDKSKIYEEATKQWGKDAQLLVAIEELAELQKAICKYMNRGGEIGPVMEEVADVEIMCEQIRHIFKHTTTREKSPTNPVEGVFEHAVDHYKNYKLKRLAKKLKIK